MSVDLFSCDYCKGAATEYDRIYCEHGHELCNCVMPTEIAKLCGCWEDVYCYITIDEHDKIIKREQCEHDYSELFSNFLTYNGDTYGILLKSEYCPLCSKIKQNSLDPEYQEYLRLKKKFES